MKRYIASFGGFLLFCFIVGSAAADPQLPTLGGSPDSGFASNSVIDIIEHNGGVWLATEDGLNVSRDSGLTWVLYNASSGLESSSISAMYSHGDRVWTATNHDELVTDRTFSFSDGVSYSDDDGETWHCVDFSQDGLNIRYVTGGYRTVFDITGHLDANDQDDWLFFTAWAGGFLASRDGGVNWRRIYSSPLDSIQYNFGGTPSDRNLYFSCVTDTSHGDSLFVWAGTAHGLFQYVYAEPRDKPFVRHINRIAFCESCEDTAYVFFGGRSGLTRGVTKGAPFISRFESGDGLPGLHLSALIDVPLGMQLEPGVLLLGTVDPTGDTAAGLACSFDHGRTFYPATSGPQSLSAADTILDFAILGSRLYMAAEGAGLFVSPDFGWTWDRILIDSLLEDSSSLNVVRAVHVSEDTLYVGTDSGLSVLFLDAVGNIDSTRVHVFDEGDSSSTRVVRIKTQKFYDEAGENLDSVICWTINRAVTDSGRPIVGRRSVDGEWFHLQVGVITNDVNFFGDTVFAVGEAGIRYTDSGGVDPWISNPSKIYQVVDSSSGSPVDSLTLDNITVMEVKGDTVIFGTDNGFAISNDRGANYRIYRVNADSLSADVVRHYTSENTSGGLVGDFVPVVGMQYLDDDYARVWVSNRHKAFMYDSVAISVSRMVPVDADGEEVPPEAVEVIAGYEYRWLASYRDGFAWNLAFDGSSAFAATNGGLIFVPADTGVELPWDTISLVDDLGYPLTLPGTPVYGVEVVGDYLWAGTDDRTSRINLEDFSEQRPFYVVDSASPPEEVYAFPVPLSHAVSAIVDFHFVVDKDAYITLKIYDFAMNLVAGVIDNEFYPAGIYPTTGLYRRTWDGYNGKGEPVAVGVYYFKVEYSTGDVHWGKLAVIP